MTLPSSHDRVTCPQCRRLEGKFLASPSDIAIVNYFHCEYCAYVWTADKPPEQPTQSFPTARES
jgi:rubredoxin